MKRKGFKDCEHSHWHNGAVYNYFIESPHSWYVSIHTSSPNLNEAREQCVNKWKEEYGKTNRKKITLHIPTETNRKIR